MYVRQSSLKQVIHNTESAIRQYDLRGKAVSLGWAADQVTVIDIDQGHSGASAADREGFQHLVAEVSLGRASSESLCRYRHKNSLPASSHGSRAAAFITPVLARVGAPRPDHPHHQYRHEASRRCPARLQNEGAYRHAQGRTRGLRPGHLVGVLPISVIFGEPLPDPLLREVIPLPAHIRDRTS